ncbi:MAG: hypothetical protein K9W45_08660 [Candidatus Heimdallarchaeum aukensis]|uniref:Uncharacterized protein n=1 Tax=Candidatus Heimdallarchaeum aukensis TaxID=2876573 RepID=A0A9Y1BJ59_9ARCH|nr:MAG: hypothetical protein K9W45_08660 [Candidatus Heimdallarchaeum aukensis]
MDFEDSIEICMKVDNINSEIDVNISEEEKDRIYLEVIQWLNDNPIRSLSSVSDFMQLLESLLCLEIKEDGRLILSTSAYSDQQLSEGLKRNKDFFNNLIKEFQNNIDKEINREYENETEEVLLLRFLNTEEQIIEGINEVSKALTKFSFNRKRRRFTRILIEALFEFLDSIILIFIRWIEISANRNTKRENLSLELLEWDINTFKSTIYNINRIAQLSQTSIEEEGNKNLAKVFIEILQQ